MHPPCRFISHSNRMRAQIQHSKQPSVLNNSLIWHLKHNFTPKCLIVWVLVLFCSLNGCICQVVGMFCAWYFINKSFTAPLRDAKLSMCSWWVIHSEGVIRITLSLSRPAHCAFLPQLKPFQSGLMLFWIVFRDNREEEMSFVFHRKKNCYVAILHPGTSLNFLHFLWMSLYKQEIKMTCGLWL